METLRTYILSVTAAAILCAIICKLGRKGSHGTLLKMMSGIVLTMVIIRPITTIAPINLSQYLKQLGADAQYVVEAGSFRSEELTRQRITDELEAYILDEAKALGMDIHVTVILEDPLLVPSSVTITGAASPYARAAMTEMLTNVLGIPKEAQIWK